MSRWRTGSSDPFNYHLNFNLDPVINIEPVEAFPALSFLDPSAVSFSSPAFSLIWHLCVCVCASPMLFQLCIDDTMFNETCFTPLSFVLSNNLNLILFVLNEMYWQLQCFILPQGVNCEEMTSCSSILNSCWFSQNQDQTRVLMVGQEEQPHWKQIHRLSIHGSDDF